MKKRILGLLYCGFGGVLVLTSLFSTNVLAVGGTLFVCGGVWLLRDD